MYSRESIAYITNVYIGAHCTPQGKNGPLALVVSDHFDQIGTVTPFNERTRVAGGFLTLKVAQES